MRTNFSWPLLFLLLTLLAGCMEADPYLNPDDDQALPFFKERSIVYIGEKKREITLKPGHRATYESRDFENIMVMGVRAENTYLVQGTHRKSDKTYYTLIRDYGPNESYGVKLYEKYLNLYVPYYIRGVPYSIKEVVWYTKQFKNSMKRHTNIAIDGVEIDLEEHNVLIYDPENDAHVRKMEMLEAEFALLSSPETLEKNKRIEFIERELTTSLRNACNGIDDVWDSALSLGEALGGQANLIGSEMNDVECEFHSAFSPTIVFGIHNIVLTNCDENTCIFEADLTCHGKGSAMVLWCIEENQKNPFYFGIISFFDDKLIMERLKTR